MAFFETLRRDHDAAWRRFAQNPFVAGIADGSLARDRFQFYLIQDDHFLVSYGKVMALAVAKSPDIATMARLSSMLSAIFNEEMSLHHEFLASYDVTPATVAATPMGQTTRAYADHLLRVAWSGSLAEIVAAMLPCHYGYLELARGMLNTVGARPEAPYSRWIHSYASEGYADGATWALALGNRLAASASDAERLALNEAYARSLDHEVRFWDAAWAKRLD